MKINLGILIFYYLLVAQLDSKRDLNQFYMWCTRDIHSLHKRENLHHIVHESERYPLITKCPPNFERNTDRILWPTITSIDLFPEFACHIFKLWEITSQE